MDAKPMKAGVLFTASSGGHLEQLLSLRSLIEEFDGVVVTEKTPYALDLRTRTEFLPQVNRHEAAFLPRIALNSLISIKLVFKYRPRVIVSTGALATIPLSIIGKVFGAKIVYIESFAKIDSPTLTGRVLYRFADRFYVQWPTMLEIFPDARYIGGIY